MKSHFKLNVISLSFFGILLTGCDSDLYENQIKENPSPSLRLTSFTKMGTQDLLWNRDSSSTSEIYGVTKRNFLHLNCVTNNCNTEAPIAYISEYSQISDKPGNVPPYEYKTDTSYRPTGYTGPLIDPWRAFDTSAPSLRLISYNWLNSRYGLYPGYAIDVAGGYSRDPIIFTIKNNSRMSTTHTFVDPIEVGLLFEHWPGPIKLVNGNVDFDASGNAKFNQGLWGFKKNYRLGNFNNIQAKFKAKLNYFYDNIATADKTVYTTADLRFAYYNNDGKKVREDLVGVIFYTGNSHEEDGNYNDAIYWQHTASTVEDGVTIVRNRVLLIGNKLSAPVTMMGVNNVYDTTFKEITINYRPLIENTDYLPAPSLGYKIDEAIITGFDVYSSTRGYDIEFDLKDTRLIGIKNP